MQLIESVTSSYAMFSEQPLDARRPDPVALNQHLYGRANLEGHDKSHDVSLTQPVTYAPWRGMVGKRRAEVGGLEEGEGMFLQTVSQLGVQLESRQVYQMQHVRTLALSQARVLFIYR